MAAEGSRLDKLLNLLETGPPTTRKLAAAQVGDVAKLHPTELPVLLRRLQGLLRNKNWDTRTAAGFAVSAVADNIRKWNPDGVKDEDITEENKATLMSALREEGDLSFINFNVNDVITCGKPLLSSGGSEYDIGLSGMTPQERIKYQRDQLKKRLGLSSSIKGIDDDNKLENFGVDTGNDLIDDADLDVDMASIPTTNGCSDKVSATDLMARIEQHTNSQTLSARERMSLKRKARCSIQKGTMKHSMLDDVDASRVVDVSRLDSVHSTSNKKHKTSVITDQPQNDNKIVVEYAVEDNDDESDIWPFRSFCEVLLHDLFDPTWQIRHGAGVGLREIIRSHAATAGITADCPTSLKCTQNEYWLENCCVRLLCVFALDRFGDFVGDQVVAPVRETCAQTLGTTLKYLSANGVCHTVRVLMDMVRQDQWEIRQGGMLGLKYACAVRMDLLDDLLPLCLDFIIDRLEDTDDDVRAVAAEVLIPIANKIAASYPIQIEKIARLLWKALPLLDDLSASTKSVMRLLPVVQAATKSIASYDYDETSIVKSLATVVPRLWPFLRHHSTSVRRAVVDTLEQLLTDKVINVGNDWLDSVLPAGLCHIFQNMLIEEKEDISQTSQRVWVALLKYGKTSIIIKLSTVWAIRWLKLLSTPTGSLINKGLTLVSKHASDLTGGIPSDASTLATRRSGEVGSEYEVTPRKRLAAALSLGHLQKYLVHHNSDVLLKAVMSFMKSDVSLQQVCAHLVLWYWAQETFLSNKCISDIYFQYPCDINDMVNAKLQLAENAGLSFKEIEPSIIKMKEECTSFIECFKDCGIVTSNVMSGIQTMTPGEVYNLCTVEYVSWTKLLSQKSEESIPWNNVQRESRQKRLLATIGYVQVLSSTILARVVGTAALTIVGTRQLPEKLNGIILPLMKSIKAEDDEQLQTLSAQGLSLLLYCCCDRISGPNDKLITNTCIMATADVPPKSDVDRSPLILRRGGEQVLITSCATFGEALFKKLPRLWSLVVGDIMEKYLLFNHVNDKNKLHIKNEHGHLASHPATPLPLPTDLVKSSLRLATVIIPHISHALHDQICQILPIVFASLPVDGVIRRSACTCLASICRHIRIKGFEAIISYLLPMFGLMDDRESRYGAMVALQTVVDDLESDILPFVIFLVVPVMGRMSDFDHDTRQSASYCFGTLVKLLPLEKGIPDPVGMNSLYLEKKDNERHFIEQLLDESKLDNYELPFPIRTELRCYQQTGLNWLMFLNKFSLHGILCDDMGLGKTLQSLCAVAADHFARRQNGTCFNSEGIEYPSLIVAPPTVVAHWEDEILKFFPNDILIPLQYMGSPNERAKKRELLNCPGTLINIIITSYDVVRNDVEFFKDITFNYIVLDEGHAIRNAKSKMSLAIKRLKSDHRLLLSGTPIQNNVLELWSLFDFLMPGFFGSEKLFQQMFSKPIQQSRDAKSTAAEQERGTLALEALHRQVLPFLLRRCKEDVLSDLPPKIIQDYYCELSPLQARLYQQFSASQMKSAIEESIVDGDESKVPVYRHVFAALQYLKKLCNHPILALTSDHPHYNEIINEVGGEAALHSYEHSPKLVALKSLLQECGIGVESNEDSVCGGNVVGNHRVLIFAQHKSMLDIIERDLFKNAMPNVTSLRLDGTVEMNKRQSIVNAFNADPSIDCLLLTTHVGGLGLNLTGADTVIFIEHDWNPMRDLQAMDRAHRIGQKRVVNVYRLITRGTLEEKIMGLQKFKLNIANSVVTRENASLKTMDTDQLLDLMTLSAVPKKGSGTKSKIPGDDHDVLDDGVPAKNVKKSGLKAVLADLEDLWDESQYEGEYNISNFLQNLN